MKNILPKTLKKRTTLIIMTSTITITILISYFCFSTFKSLLRKNLIQSTGSNLQLVMKNIENDMSGVINLAKWCTNNDLISNYVSNAPDNITSSNKLNTYYRLKEEFLNSEAGRYIRRLIISNPKHALLQMGTSAVSEGRLSDGETSSSTQYFKELMEYNNFKWIGLQREPFKNSTGTFTIPIARPIYNTSNTEVRGWLYMSIDPKIITDYLQNYKSEMGSETFIGIGDKTYMYNRNSLEEISVDYTIKESRSVDYNPNIFYCIVQQKSGEYITVVYYKSNINGWYIAQTLPNNQFMIQKTEYLALIFLIIFLLITLGTSLSLIFNRMINKPIIAINKKIISISAGDFSQDQSIESDDEIGTIGKGINILSKDIVELINSEIENEKQKKELEFKVLQNQINPHFLYNTLNSIKWMATIQNASGIPEMTTALARLLRNIAKGTSELITIREEIDLLGYYVTIQKYRYGGSINVNYNIESEELYDCKMIKFTMQPIVENSIFHGIEPKGIEGKIDINIKKVDDKFVQIEIVDNGVGIPEEKIEKILKSKDVCNKNSFNNIGVSNVNERIKLIFGNEYGLKIKSKLNEYTSMIIIIPYKR